MVPPSARFCRSMPCRGLDRPVRPSVAAGVYLRVVGITEEDVARTRAATDFVALAGEHMALKRVGRRWVGLCPFHGEKTPSLSTNAEEGPVYCFGCGAKCDAIPFVR